MLSRRCIDTDLR